jgi:outer membrane biosynthesis protein TonB
MTISRTTLSLPGLALAAALLAPCAALAEGEEVAQCAAKWIAAKADPKFYQPWGDYFSDCKKKLAEAAAPKAAEPAPEPEAKKAEAPKPAPAPAAAPAAAPKPAAAPTPAPAPAAEPAKPEKPANPGAKPAKKHPAHKS